MNREGSNNPPGKLMTCLKEEQLKILSDNWVEDRYLCAQRVYVHDFNVKCLFG